MRADLFLVESANIDAQRRLNALGLGWTRTVTPLPPHALVLMFEFEDLSVGLPYVFSVEIDLVDLDGEPVILESGERVHIEGEFTAEADPNDEPGIPDRNFTKVDLAPWMPLPPGQYEYRLNIDGKDVATQRFLVVEPDIS